MDDVIEKMNRLAGRRFSPMVTACLSDRSLAERLVLLLEDDGEAYYKEILEQ